MKRATYRGQVIDIDLLRIANQSAIAVGNANYNARGDLIGRGGTVLKTREELEQERLNNKLKDDAFAQISAAQPEEPVVLEDEQPVTNKPQSIRKKSTAKTQETKDTSGE